MSIDELKNAHTKVELDLHIVVQPLRDRIKRLGCIIFLGCTGYRVSRGAGRKSVSIDLDDQEFERIMALSDKELSQYLISLGLLNEH